MLIVLPPSEGKIDPSSLHGHAPLDLAALSLPELAEARVAVLEALHDAGGRPDATDLLGVPASLGALVAANLDLPDVPAAPAARVYTGVLYDAAGLAGLSGRAARRARSDVLIASALYGAVHVGDRIAPYRLGMTATLPALGGAAGSGGAGGGSLARFWRAPLATALDDRASGDVVIDARSAAYVAAWTPPADAEHVAVRVVTERAGRRTVVSHNAKYLRGVLTGHLLRRDARPPRTAAGVLEAAGELVGTESPTGTVIDAGLEPAARRGPDTLTTVTRAAW